MNSITPASIAAIAIGVAALGVAGAAYMMSDSMSQPPQTREIFLFTQVDETIDEDRLGIPPDLFSAEEITVNAGDKVRINFYNLEPAEKQEAHTFTINAGPYKMNYEVAASDSAVIEFDADTPGIYEYVCTYHLPTMRGSLIVT